MTRYATTVTLAIYTSDKPTGVELARISGAANSAYETLSDAIPAATEITFGDPETHEVPDPEPPTLNKVGQRGRVIRYDDNDYLILGLSATEPVWTVVRPNPERNYGQSDWETDRIDGTASVELVESWEYVPWVDDAAEYFCIEVAR